MTKTATAALVERLSENADFAETFWPGGAETVSVLREAAKALTDLEREKQEEVARWSRHVAKTEKKQSNDR